MNLQEKKSVLTQLYKIYDDYIATKQLACHERCSGCCTINVTLTSTEGHLVFSELKQSHTEAVFQKLEEGSARQRFQPATTPNGMVAALMNNQPPPPEESSNPDWGKCPLLVEDRCSVYNTRPFECRSFVSTKDCSRNHVADMPEEIIAVNNTFKQYIEHTDADGYTANMMDMLIYLNTRRKRHLIKNQPIPMLMVDPEHQAALEPLIDKIQAIQIKIE